MIDKLSSIKGKKVFVPTGFSALHDPKFESYFLQITKWLHDYDMSVFLSDDYRDVNFAKEGASSRDLVTILSSDKNFSRPLIPFHL